MNTLEKRIATLENEVAWQGTMNPNQSLLRVTDDQLEYMKKAWEIGREVFGDELKQPDQVYDTPGQTRAELARYWGRRLVDVSLCIMMEESQERILGRPSELLRTAKEKLDEAAEWLEKKEAARA